MRDEPGGPISVARGVAILAVSAAACCGTLIALQARLLRDADQIELGP